MIGRLHITAFILIVSAYRAAGENSVSVAGMADLIVRTADKYHYAPNSVDNGFSENVYNSFLNILDPYGLLFSKETCMQLGRFKQTIDDDMRSHKTSFLDTARVLYVKQLHTVDSIVRQIECRDIDFHISDTLWIKKPAVYVDRKALGKRWRQWIKYMALNSIQNNADSTGTITMPSEEDRNKIVRDVIARELCRIHSKTNPDDGINAFTGEVYLEAVSGAFDPHSVYLSIAEEKIWERDLSKEAAMFGFTVDFNMAGEIEITDVFPGGPAWITGQLNEGDVILNIKKKNGTVADLQCISISDVHKILSEIDNEQTEFKIRKKNGRVLSVNIRKKVIDVEGNTIRSFILKGRHNVGYINLPSFYADFTYNGFYSKGCANDMAMELVRLRTDSIDGLILDLRSNSGGSLTEALRMAGIFIDFGPLCITGTRGQSPKIEKDGARGAVYSGPLVVLVNSSSASASELFAGVLQDYNRALITGTKTFGKSTIQTLLPVDACRFDSHAAYSGKPCGFLILTTGSFYRVTGESYQKHGVVPDIELPDQFENMQFRESSYENPLELGSISKNTYYKPLSALPVDELKKLSYLRQTNSQGFRYIKKIASTISEMEKSFPVPLDFNLFVKQAKLFSDEDDSAKIQKSGFTTAFPEYNKGKSIQTDREKTENDVVMSKIGRDIYINETMNVMNDLIEKKYK